MFRKLFLYLEKLIKYKPESEARIQTEKKLLLIIKARWVVLGILLLYGIFSFVSYLFFLSTPETIKVVSWPAILLLIAVVYNSINHIAWHKSRLSWLKRIKLIIRAQIIIDILAVTLLIHFTGGITSWFWTLYILLIIEHFQLSPNQREVFLMGSINVLFYSTLIFAEYFKLVEPVKMPFAISHLSDRLTYVLIVWSWVFILNMATVYMGSFLRRKDELAIKDGLTGVYNRRFFEHVLKSEIERARRFKHAVSLLIIDIDNFKTYNDTYGHQEGDNLLKIVGNILSYNIRRSVESPTYDIDIACRYGGEEFAVILPETGNLSDNLSRTQIQANGAFILAEKLREQIKAECGLTVSIGVATYPLGCEDYYDLIMEADKALYKAKSLGKDRVVVAPPLLSMTEEKPGEIINVAKIKGTKILDGNKPKS